MELVDILVLGTSAERRAGSNPAVGSRKNKALQVIFCKAFCVYDYAGNVWITVQRDR